MSVPDEVDDDEEVEDEAEGAEGGEAREDHGVGPLGKGGRDQVQVVVLQHGENEQNRQGI